MKSTSLIALAALLSLSTAALAAPKSAPAPAGPTGPTEADWRVPDANNLLLIETSKGRVIVEMAPDVAPLHAERLRTLARQGLYDGRSFFRVIDNFMDQTGDPSDNGTGQSQLPNLPPEFTFRRDETTPFVSIGKVSGVEMGFIGSLPVLSQPMDLGLLTVDHKVSAYAPYCTGVAGMARSDAPDSANSQFFLMRTNATAPDHATHSLDQKYTVWGRVISGQDVVNAIATGEPPASPDKMLTVKVFADIPEAQRPRVRVLDVRGPWFKVLATRIAAQKVVGASICDFDLPSDVK